MFVRPILSVFFSLLTLSSFGQAVTDVKPRNIDYQIHSNNDLKELRQVLIKGSRKFKFDLHYVSGPADCGDGIDACFLLTHDKPSKNSQYNSSVELLNYLTSPEFNQLTNNEYVSIALCFKKAPDKCKQDSAAFQSWLNLVDEFHSQAVANVPSNVEFILDGDAKPAGCLVGKWKPWNSVWIVDSNNEAFTSNSIENDNYRFAILNNPENITNWEWMARGDVNYGKFSNSSYPYQLWEPDSQSDIQEYKDIYLAGAQHPAGYHFAINSDIAMFHVYSSSVGKYANHADVPRGINQLLDSTALHGMKDKNNIGENPKIATFNSNSNKNKFLSVYINTESKSLFYVIITADVESYAITTSNPVKFPSTIYSTLGITDDNKVQKVVSLSSESGDATAVFLLITQNGAMVQVTMVPDGNDHDGWTVSDTFYSGKLPMSGSGGRNGDRDGEMFDVVLLSTETAAAADSATFTVLVLSTVEGILSGAESTEGSDVNSHSNNSRWPSLKKSLVLSTVELTTHKDTSSLTVKVVSSQTIQTNSRHEIDSAAVVVITAPPYLAKGEAAVASEMAATKKSTDMSVLLFVSQNKRIFGTEITASTLSTVSTDGANDSDKTAQRTVRWVQITAGQSLSASYNTQDGMLLLVNDYGYCYNSHQNNIQASPTICSATPKPSKYALDYTLGALSVWRKMLKTSTCVTTVTAADAAANTDACYAVNSCHDTILHGTYDQGSNPAVILTSQPIVSADSASEMKPTTDSSNTQQEYQSFLLELHEGVPTTVKKAPPTHVIIDQESVSTSTATADSTDASAAAAAADVSLKDSSSSSVVTNGCGEPIHRDGIVVDSFEVDSWIKALKRL